MGRGLDAIWSYLQDIVQKVQANASAAPGRAEHEKVDLGGISEVERCKRIMERLFNCGPDGRALGEDEQEEKCEQQFEEEQFEGDKDNGDDAQDTDSVTQPGPGNRDDDNNNNEEEYQPASNRMQRLQRLEDCIMELFQLSHGKYRDQAVRSGASRIGYFESAERYRGDTAYEPDHGVEGNKSTAADGEEDYESDLGSDQDDEGIEAGSDWDSVFGSEGSDYVLV
ncbi:hypothetical protein BJX70DRAFT_375836 [Aspergillus crustosus]